MAIPVTLDEAKRQLRLEVDDTDQDDEIAGFVADAAAWVESYTGHLFSAGDVTERFRGYQPVTLRAWPIAADAVAAVTYVDSDGTPTAIPGIRLDLSGQRGRVSPATGHFWPFRDAQQIFTVIVRAGYEDPESVPRNLKRAMLVLIAAYDADREGGDTFAKAEEAARRLCSRFRVHRL